MVGVDGAPGGVGADGSHRRSDLHGVLLGSAAYALVHVEASGGGDT